MKRASLALTSAILLTMVSSAQGFHLLETIDPRMDCGINPDELKRCLSIEEKTDLDRKAKAFCKNVMTFANNKLKLTEANNSLKEKPSFLTKRKQMKQINSLSKEQKPLINELMKYGITSEQLGKIPAIGAGQVQDFKCKQAIQEGKVYKGKIIANDILNPSKVCGLDLEKVQVCIEKERGGGAGKGESFCNDVKLFAGNKQKIKDMEEALQKKPNGVQRQILQGLNELQSEYTELFKKVGLDSDQLNEIPALSRETDANFKCADKVTTPPAE